MLLAHARPGAPALSTERRARQQSLASVANSYQRAFVVRGVSERAAPLVRPQASWILDNKYFSGVGQDGKQKKLSERGLLAVLDNLSEDFAAGKAINLKTFEEEYCASQKAVEVWLYRKEQFFGTQLCQLPIWTRCADHLRSNRLRPQVRACMLRKKQFDGETLPGHSSWEA